MSALEWNSLVQRDGAEGTSSERLRWTTTCGRYRITGAASRNDPMQFAAEVKTEDGWLGIGKDSRGPGYPKLYATKVDAESAVEAHATKGGSSVSVANEEPKAKPEIKGKSKVKAKNEPKAKTKPQSAKKPVVAKKSAEKPAKKAKTSPEVKVFKAPKKSKEAPPKTAPRSTRAPRELRPEGAYPGILVACLNRMKEATKDDPITREGLLEYVKKLLPDRDPDKLWGTIKYAAGRIKYHYGIKPSGNAKTGYWIRQDGLLD